MIKSPFLYCIFLFLIASGCGFSANKEEAKSVMDQFFQNRIEEGSIGHEKYYSDLFLESTNPEEWDRIKALVNKANGNLISHEETGWQVQKKANSSKLSGTFVHFSYKTVYENGEGSETISLIKNKENPSFKIINHHFKSTMIQQLINKGIDEAVETE